MRILHTSDWHLGRSLENISRLDEQREFVDCLCKICDEKQINLVLVAGDIYDTYNPSAAAEEIFFEAVERLSSGGRRAIVAIAGNHDNPERLCASSPLAYKDGIILIGYPGSDISKYRTCNGNIRIIDSGSGWFELSIKGCDHNSVLITLPYPSEARLEQLLSLQADEELLQKAYSDKIGSIFSALQDKFREDTVNLVIGHLFLLGGKGSESERTLQVGGALTVEPGVLPSKAHFAALGHLHRPQEIKNSPCPVFYSGSPLAYSFSEADYSKAIYIIEAVPGKKAIIQAEYLSCGKPLRKWVAVEGIAQALKWCEEGRDRDAWVDLEIITERVLTSEEQKSLRSSHPGLVNIRPILKSGAGGTQNPETREGRKIDELFGDFYRYRMGRDIPEELKAAFIEVIGEDNAERDGSAGGGEVL